MYNVGFFCELTATTEDVKIPLSVQSPKIEHIVIRSTKLNKIFRVNTTFFYHYKEALCKRMPDSMHNSVHI